MNFNGTKYAFITQCIVTTGRSCPQLSTFLNTNSRRSHTLLTAKGALQIKCVAWHSQLGETDASALRTEYQNCSGKKKFTEPFLLIYVVGICQGERHSLPTDDLVHHKRGTCWYAQVTAVTIPLHIAQQDHFLSKRICC